MTFSFNVKGLTPQDANTGTGGGGEAPTGGVLPKNIAGLVMCLDGEINSRQGVHDESIKGMQNLVYTPFSGKTSTAGVIEVLNGTLTFKDKAITLGGTCFYPNYNITDKLTLEFIFQLNNNETPYNVNRLISANYNTGFQAYILDSNNRFCFQAYTTDGKVAKNTDYRADWNSQKNYIAITTDLSKASSTKFYVNGEEITGVLLSDEVAVSPMSGSYNVGIGGVRSTSTESVAYDASNTLKNGSFYGGKIDFSLFRMWSRTLTPDEIKQNYLQDKKRFG